MPQGGEVVLETDVIAVDAEFCRNNPYEITPGPYSCVSITDTGSGMTDEVKKRLFEPFFTTKKPGQGTGMGLASVYGAVRNHRGAISILSEVGRGTTVRIYLPLAPGASEPEQAIAEAAPVQGTAWILLVDDEAIIRQMATEMLRGLGFGVETCANGREAVEYYRANWQQVDLVILDMAMPEMGGRDTFLAMRQINPQIRALLSSGYSLNEEAQGILNEGVLGFVAKPYGHAELSRRVAEALLRK
jgi:CheY-like chemotaxis protein